MEQTTLDLPYKREKTKAYIPYRLGLDIGIGSTGAAAVADGQILGIHVNTFPAGEIRGKSGRKALNEDYRQQKSQRRRLRRKKHRLLCLRRLLRREGIIPSTNVNNLRTDNYKLSPWQMRAEGLDRKLTPNEWGIVLYHIAKHRGFQSNRRVEFSSDSASGDGEAKKMIAGAQDNAQLRESKGYRTIGEAVARDERFEESAHNKGEDYTHTIGRDEINREVAELFASQRTHGNPYTSHKFEESVVELINRRRPTVTSHDIKRMAGKCTLEPTEYRAPKNAPSAEKFRWLSFLKNIRINAEGISRSLTDQEFEKLQDKPWSQETVTYKTIRAALELPSPSVRFNIKYDTKKLTEKDSKPITQEDKERELRKQIDKTEKSVAFTAKGFHALRKSYSACGHQAAWRKDQYDFIMLDTLVEAVTFYRDDKEIEAYLEAKTKSSDKSIPDHAQAVTLNLSPLTGLARLSIKAIRKITPYLENGYDYSEACAEAGYRNHHKQWHDRPTSGRIPKDALNHITNPVVKRSLNQARKMINATISEYGLPQAIHIELARDIDRSSEGRDNIDKNNRDRKKARDKLAAEAENRFGYKPNGEDLLKYQLYLEQHGQCAYSQKPISLDRLLEQNYTEIDHALPRSRSMDNSYNNKVLVLTAQNRNKTNKTPWEYFGESEESTSWQRYKAWVESNPNINEAKKNKILTRDLKRQCIDSFSNRNLSDTRYIARELKTLIEHYVLSIESNEFNTKSRCVVIPGGITSQIRRLWGITKDREQSDLHHGSDAAVIACITEQTVARVTNFLKLKEQRANSVTKSPAQGERVYAPKPWKTFREDVNHALSTVRVSRPQNGKLLGSFHGDTIYRIRSSAEMGGTASASERDTVKIQRIPLTKLTKSNYENIVGFDDPRNKDYIDQIVDRLKNAELDGKKAFSKDMPPIYRKGKNGKPGPKVNKVRIITNIGDSGMHVRGGFAENGKNSTAMIRLYQCKKNGKTTYKLEPVYYKDLANGHNSTNEEINNATGEMWSLHTTFYIGDYVEIVDKNGEVHAGYVARMDVSSNRIVIRHHKHASNGAKSERIYVRNAKSIIKYNIDILGRKWRT